MKKLIIPFLLIASITASAQLRLPAIFTDHMVIQRESTVPVWGWGAPGWEVVVKTSWDTTTVKTMVSNKAQWKVELKTPKAGGPYTITIRSGMEIKIISDVLSGEVWICSGQSNMEWPMAITDGKELVPTINDPTIRLMQIPKSGSSTRQEHGEGQWTACDKSTISSFSSVGYFFGKRLNTELNVPIGLINVSWSGSNAESWTSTELVMNNPVLAEAAKKQENNMWWPNEPGVIFNSMIAPLTPFKIAGVIWYQGESNIVAAPTYKTLMEALISGWRKDFNTEFPFYYVQIAPFAYEADRNSMLLREQQVKMLQIAKTGMVVISDHVDNVKDIHPVNKKPVGDRLANLALSEVYGKKGITYLTPLYKSMKIEKDKIRISFNNVPTTLISKGGELVEFMIAGDDKKFYPAKAKIDGNTVIVSAKEVKSPVAVRFAWGNAVIGNLFSKEGLPVSVFRTDDWEDKTN